METEERIQRVVVWLPVLGRFVRVSIMGTKVDDDPAVLLSGFTGLILLMIPGNPGNEQFYAHFGKIILSKISKCMQISVENFLFCTVSHLNHVPAAENCSKMGIYTCTDRISLADQIEYKFNFCLQYLSKTAKVILIGHSIGSYLMLRISPDLLQHGFNVVRCIALFPTIEHMAKSPNGRRLLPWLKKLRNWDGTVQIMLSWLQYLPYSIKKRICIFLLRDQDRLPPCVLQSAIEIFNVNVIRNIIFMTMDELQTVSNLDESLLHHSDRCRFLYGTRDQWCPLRYALEMQERVGKDLVIIDDKKCEHAFVLNHNEEVATEVVEWIIDCCD